MDTGADQYTCVGSAWIPVYDAGEKVQYNGYYQGVGAKEAPVVPIMSVVTCADIPGEEPSLMIFHQTCYINDDAQVESLCLPYQSMNHGVDIDTKPTNYTKKEGDQGMQRILVEDKEIN